MKRTINMEQVHRKTLTAMGLVFCVWFVVSMLYVVIKPFLN